MLNALLHFAIGFCAVAGITYTHARLLGEANGSCVSAGLVSGILCASLATFATNWATLLVIVLLGTSSHKEYLQARKYKAQMERRQDESTNDETGT